MARKTIKATIVDTRPGDKAHGKSAYLRIEATDGRTYTRCVDWFRKTSVIIYSTWLTGSRDPDVAVTFGKMPKAVRDLMRANPNPFAA